MPITPPQNDRQGQVNAAVDTRYKAPIQRAEGDLALIPGDLQANLDALEFYRTRGKGAIEDAYKLAGERMEQNRAATEKRLGDEVVNLQNVYAGTRNVSEAARQLASQRLAELGGNIGAGQQAMVAAATPMEQAAQRMLEQMGMSEAGAVGNLSTWGAQQDALMREGISMGERERAGEISDFESELGRSLAQARFDATDRERELRNRLLDIFTERGAFATDYGYKLDERDWNQLVQAAQFNLSEQEAAAAAAARAASAALAREQFEFDRQQYAERMASPERQLELALQRAKLAEMQDSLGQPESLFEWARNNKVAGDSLDFILNLGTGKDASGNPTFSSWKLQNELLTSPDYDPVSGRFTIPAWNAEATPNGGAGWSGFGNRYLSDKDIQTLIDLVGT